MKPNLLIFAATLLAATSLTASEGKATLKNPPSQKVTTVQPKPAPPVARVRWQIPSERPCESTACRPVRFAWSPTAPGS